MKSCKILGTVIFNIPLTVVINVGYLQISKYKPIINARIQENMTTAYKVL